MRDLWMDPHHDDTPHCAADERQLLSECAGRELTEIHSDTPRGRNSTSDGHAFQQLPTCFTVWTYSRRP